MEKKMTFTETVAWLVKPVSASLTKEEVVDICRKLLEAAGSNAVIVENPRLFLNMDGGLIEEIKSNIPGIQLDIFDSDKEYLDWDDPNNPGETEEEFWKRYELACAKFEVHKDRAAEGLEDNEFTVIAADNLPRIEI